VRILITVIGCFIFFSASAQKLKHAEKYIDYITKQQKNVMKEFFNYNKSISYVSKKHTTKKIQGRYNELMTAINEAKSNIDSLPSFKRDSTHKDSIYRDSASSYFKQFSLVLSNSYNKVATLQATAGQSYGNMEAYLEAKEAADKKLKILNEHFYAITLKFANSNKAIDSTRKDLASKKMGDVIEAGKYFRQAYLIFFKSYKQEADVQNAIERKDVNDLKKSAKDLAKSSEDGQSRLDTIPPFKNNKALTADSKAVLAFYEKEAEDKLDPIEDYFSAAKDFDEVRSTFNRKSGHSGPEVKKYKKSVAIFNKALHKYNKAMNGLYKKKKSLLKKMDNTTHSFFNKFKPTIK
jgi:hypothetical protein